MLRMYPAFENAEVCLTQRLHTSALAKHLVASL